MMIDPERGTDRAGRRSKRFLTPLQKYEIFLQLVRQELTLAEAADSWKVDRSTIMRIRTDLDAFHRQHATVELVIRDLKQGAGLDHCPSGNFSANSAWLQCAVLALNLIRWTATIGQPVQALTVARRENPTAVHPRPDREPLRHPDPASSRTLAVGRPVHHRLATIRARRGYPLGLPSSVSVSTCSGRPSVARSPSSTLRTSDQAACPHQRFTHRPRRRQHPPGHQPLQGAMSHTDTAGLPRPPSCLPGPAEEGKGGHLGVGDAAERQPRLLELRVHPSAAGRDHGENLRGLFPHRRGVLRPGDYLLGANIAGFLRVSQAITALGLI